MHVSSKLRMEWFVKKFLEPMSFDAREKIKVIDIGSYDVNGNYKELFPPAVFQYTGLDMSEGPNVDFVPRLAYNWTEVKDASFDVVICGQVFEHLEFPWVTFSEMVRILKPRGLMCIIVPRTQPRHRHPVDTYRYDIDGLAAFFRYGNLKILHVSTNLAPPEAPLAWYNDSHSDCLGIARKPVGWKAMLDIANYAYEPLDLEAYASGFVEKDCHPELPVAVKKHYLREIRKVKENLKKTGSGAHKK